MALSALRLSLLVSGAAIVWVLILGTIIAWRLATMRRAGRLVIESVLMLPLVLPPTVVGFALLLTLGRGTALGAWINDSLGIHLLFTWQGASLAAAVMSLPLYTLMASTAFASIEPEHLDTARVFGAGELTILARVMVPMTLRALVAGACLALARSLGEFGATLMIAGSIPGRTRTLSLALYSAVESGEDRAAVQIALLLVCLTLALIGSLGMLGSRLRLPMSTR
jgi:molybdate transport system permease protein